MKTAMHPHVHPPIATHAAMQRISPPQLLRRPRPLAMAKLEAFERLNYEIEPLPVSEPELMYRLPGKIACNQAL